MIPARKTDDMIISTDGSMTEPFVFEGTVYGPVTSRRFGRSLGINILGEGAKICSFDCPYCHLGPTTTRLNKLKEDGIVPTAAEIAAKITETFRTIHTSGPIVDTVTISGNGEATLHPDFPEIVDRLIEARDAWLPGKQIVLLTNGAAFDSRKIADAANKLDVRIVKIDAGNDKMFKSINAPLARVNLARVIAGTRNLKDFVVQSLFCQGLVDNTRTTDLEDWIEVLAILKPKAVQIHGLSREAAQSGLIRCDEDTLHTIASKLERRTGIKATVTP
ncbi:MAG: radical SAM protein [Bdellovibrionota bacterium]